MSSKLEDFKILSRLGEGAYSSVYKVRRISDNQTFALKKVRMLNLSEKEKQNALNEVRILASINDKNIISFKEAFNDDTSQALCIIMEYADDGDVFTKIVQHQKEETKFDEDFIWRIFISVVRGLKALHDLKIMHRDLKSANVFLNKDGSGKLGDFNVSKVVEKGLSYTQTGTPYYASPEVWRDEPYDAKSDIWSLGCVLYEMITLKPPFRSDNMQGLYKKVIKGQYPKISDKYSVDLQTIVRILLQVSPKKRPTCSEILNHAIVKKKIEELFPDDESSDSDEEHKNILLKTIYVIDKLPNPISTGFDRGAFTERQSIDNRSDKSILLPSISKSQAKKNLYRSKPKKRSGYNKEESKIAKSYLKREVKPKDYISRVEQKAIETDDTKISKNPKESVRNLNKESEKRLINKDLHESPVKEDKSLEENKSHKGDMNIDKEYEELKKILNVGPKKEDDTPEKRLYMVKKVNSREDSGNQKESIASTKGGSRNILLDRNIPSTRSNQVVKTNNPKGNNHVGDGILYKVKGQNRYRANIITKPKKIALNEKYNKLEMGIVGSPIISTNSRIKALRKESKRRDEKVTSLDTRLPRISDDSYKEFEQKPIVSSSVNLKLPTLKNSNKKIAGIYGGDSKSIYKSNLQYKYNPGSNYRYYSKDRGASSKRYLSKIEHSQSVNVTKLPKKKPYNAH